MLLQLWGSTPLSSYPGAQALEVSGAQDAFLTMARLKTPPTGPSFVASVTRARAPSSELALLVDTSTCMPWRLHSRTCLAW